MNDDITTKQTNWTESRPCDESVPDAMTEEKHAAGTLTAHEGQAITILHRADERDA